MKRFGPQRWAAVWVGFAWLPVAAAPAKAWAEDSPKPDPTTETPGLDPEATKRKLARDLAWEGVDLFEAGRAADASERFEHAYRLQPVPTVGLWSARALRERGLLLEASERFAEVLRSEAQPDEPQVYAAARRDASLEYDQLRLRIPTIAFNMVGATLSEVNVQLDGAQVQTELLGLALPANPGRHEVVAHARGQERIVQFDLSEGATQVITLKFAPVVEASPAPTVAAKSTHLPPEPGAQIPAGVWLSYGIAVAGAGIGIGLGLSAAHKRDELRRACPDFECPPGLDEPRKEFNQHRVGSLIGYSVGIAGAALGTIIWWRYDTVARGVAVWPGGAAFRGAF